MKNKMKMIVPMGFRTKPLKLEIRIRSENWKKKVVNGKLSNNLEASSQIVN